MPHKRQKGSTKVNHKEQEGVKEHLSIPGRYSQSFSVFLGLCLCNVQERQDGCNVPMFCAFSLSVLSPVSDRCSGRARRDKLWQKPMCSQCVDNDLSQCLLRQHVVPDPTLLHCFRHGMMRGRSLPKNHCTS